MKKYVNGQYIELTQEEIQQMEQAQKEWEEQQKDLQPTLEEQVAELKAQNETLTQCVLEMSMKVYE